MNSTIPTNSINRRNLFSVVSFILVFIAVRVSSAGNIPVESLIPKKDIPGGYALIDGSRVYTKKSLFERINGQAELFFQYGFQKSAAAIFQDKKDQKIQIELDIYDMGTVLQAFGIFSRFRGENGSAGVGLGSHLEDNSLLFYKGRYFVMLYATESDSSLLKRMAMTISSSILDSTPAPKQIGYFPKDGLRPGSIKYYPEGLLGYQFFRRGFQAAYFERVEDKDKPKNEEREFHLFLAMFNNSQGVPDALKAYRDSLSKRGKTDSAVPARFGPNGLKGEDPGRGKVIIVAKGFYLAGITGFDNVRNAEKLLEAFIKNIQ